MCCVIVHILPSSSPLRRSFLIPRHKSNSHTTAWKSCKRAERRGESGARAREREGNVYKLQHISGSSNTCEPWEFVLFINVQIIDLLKETKIVIYGVVNDVRRNWFCLFDFDRTIFSSSSVPLALSVCCARWRVVAAARRRRSSTRWFSRCSYAWKFKTNDPDGKARAERKECAKGREGGRARGPVYVRCISFTDRKKICCLTDDPNRIRW